MRHNLGVAVTLDAAFNIIGTNSDGAADETERNIVSGAWSNVSSAGDYGGGFGIVLGGQGVTGNIVAGNYVGTDPTGTLAVPNRASGIRTIDAGPNLIGTNADGIRDFVDQYRSGPAGVQEP